MHTLRTVFKRTQAGLYMERLMIWVQLKVRGKKFIPPEALSLWILKL